MIPVWRNCGQGVWDQSILDAALAGTLWPLPVAFEVVPEPRERGVMVVHGEVAKREPPPHPPDGTILIHTSDEHQGWRAPAAGRLWLMHADPVRQRHTDRHLVPGWPPGTREALAGIHRRPIAERRLWGFAGQVQNDSRRAFVDAVRSRPDGELHLSGGFAQGLDRPAFLRFLSETAIAPSPAGNANPEGFRLYEALEAGCLPITQRAFPGWPSGFDWWRWVLGELPPWPVVDEWDQIHRLLDFYAAHRNVLQHDATRAGAWWCGFKRRLAQALVDDVRVLGTPVEEAMVTVIVSSSVVPSHPSTAMIEDTIRRVRAYPELATAEVIICCDGLPPEQEHRRADYEEYLRRLVDLCNVHPDFRGCLPLIFEGHTHQANMTRKALELARTQLLFFVEHDTFPQGEIDFAGIMRVLLETSFANTIRLHVFHEVLKEHEPLYTDLQIQDVCGVPLMRTTDWSQRPHLSKTQWYRDQLETYVPKDKAMWIEHALHGPIDAAPWEEFRTCIYAPAGNMTRSGHADGRRLGASDAQ